jgi:predicted amidohydrolase
MISIGLLKVYIDWRKPVYCVPVCHSSILAIDQALADIAEQVPDFNAHESGRKGSQGILGVTELG